MSLDTSLYTERTSLKEKIKATGLSQSAFAIRAGYVPSTLRAKLNGDAPMDSLEERKILADIEAMKVGVA